MKKLLLLLISIGSFYISSATVQPYSWKQKANFGGSARAGSFGFSIDSLGYVGGGDDGTIFNDFWQYSPATNSWTQKSSVPSVVTDASSFVINGKGYVTGGVTNAIAYNIALWMYDPAANTWATKATYPGNPAYGAAAFAIDTEGYFGVGNGGSATGPYYKEFYGYDAANDSWSQKATFPGPQRFAVYGISLNGKGYLGFGGDANLGISYNDWWQYDPGTDSWTGKASLPDTARDYPSGFTINNLIYIGVGDYYNTIALSSFYQYDPISDTWTKEENYGGGVRTVGIGFSIGNIGYFGTGLGYDYIMHNNDFWEYAPDSIAVASFQSSNTILCTNSCVNFTNQSINATSWLWSFPGATPDTSTDQNPSFVCYLTAGNYSVTLIASNDMGGDTLTFSNYINVNPSPPTPDIIQQGNILYCSTDSSYISYQWFSDDTLIPGATDTFLVVSQSGNYNVQVSNKYGCKIAAGINVILGIQNYPDDNTISIYPNPATNQLTIQTQSLHTKQPTTITIINLLGETIQEEKLKWSSETSINIKTLPAGLYFIEIASDSFKSVGKFVKE